MSKLNDLIKEMCPNGVKKHKLQDLVKFENGKGHERVVNKYGKYILLTSKAISTNLKCYRRTDEQLSPLYKDDITMVMSDLPNGKALAKCFLVDQDNLYTLNQRICRLTLNDQNILPKYLYYLLNRNCQLLQYDNGVDQTNLRKNDILKVELLIPPLEVQEEIVRILDKFGELEADLEAELEARKSQYEFWRGKLLENSKKKVKFGDVATIVRGGSPRPIKNFITDDDNGIPWIKIGDTNPNDKYVFDTKEKITVDGSKKSRFVKAGDFILSNSMSFGRPYILKIDGCIHDGWLSISNFEDIYIPDFLYHLLSSKPIQDTMAMKASIGTVKNLNADIVKSIELPLYTKVEQKKIVRILDKFEELTNDISVGLPAEIELRRQQYEYYRNKLLSFEELSIN